MLLHCMHRAWVGGKMVRLTVCRLVTGTHDGFAASLIGNRGQTHNVLTLSAVCRTCESLAAAFLPASC
jgi:hypothetical protein